jgi:ABC-type polysaccharide/polyol phosphate export permease
VGVAAEAFAARAAVTPAAQRSAAAPMKIIGPGVIDFELYATCVALDWPENPVRFDAVSSLLYVDRRGAPENTQAGLDAVGKATLLRALIETSRDGDRESWITEVNWPLREGPHSPAGRHVAVDEETQASYLARYYLLMLGSGLVERVYWWQLVARGYGLADRDEGGLRRRPAWHALRFLAATLGGSRALGPLPAAAPLRVHAFEGASGGWLVAWSAADRPWTGNYRGAETSVRSRWKPARDAVERKARGRGRAGVRRGGGTGGRALAAGARAVRPVARGRGPRPDAPRCLLRRLVEIERPRRRCRVVEVAGVLHRLLEALLEQAVAILHGGTLALEDLLGARTILLEPLHQGVERLAAGGSEVRLAVVEDLTGRGVDHQIGGALGADDAKAVGVGHRTILLPSLTLRPRDHDRDQDPAPAPVAGGDDRPRAQGALPRLGARLPVVARQSAPAARGLHLRVQPGVPAAGRGAVALPVFLVAGIFPWAWVSSSLNEATAALANNAALIRRSVFPVELLPLVAVLSNLVNFLLSVPILIGALLVARALGHPVGGPWIVLLPLVIALHLAFLCGTALGLAALAVHFKDVRDLVTNLLTLAFFLTPILYSIDAVPHRALRALIRGTRSRRSWWRIRTCCSTAVRRRRKVWAGMAVAALVAWSIGAWVFDRLSDTLIEAV